MPAELGALPALRTLDISLNPHIVLEPSRCPWLLRLSALRCDASHALQLAPLLPDAQLLATLALRHDANPAASPAALSAALLLMPSLTALRLEEYAQAEASRLQTAMLARPDVRIAFDAHCDDDVEPRFPSAFSSYTWQKLSAASLR